MVGLGLLRSLSAAAACISANAILLFGTGLPMHMSMPRAHTICSVCNTVAQTTCYIYGTVALTTCYIYSTVALTTCYIYGTFALTTCYIYGTVVYRVQAVRR